MKEIFPVLEAMYRHLREAEQMHIKAFPSFTPDSGISTLLPVILCLCQHLQNQLKNITRR